MRNLSRVSCVLLFVAVIAQGCSVVFASSEAQRGPDAICQTLFQEYIVRGGKIPTNDILAATELIVSRGRPTGFWRPVLEGLRKVKGWDEIRYVRILGMMLGDAAFARKNLSRESQMGGVFALPEEVVPELISRAEKASDQYILDAYILAFARARDPRAKELLMRLVKGADEGANWPSVKYHAAVGLAELGDSGGVEWLVAHSDDAVPDVRWGRPENTTSHQLSSVAIRSLQILSGNAAVTTKAEFEAWWKVAAAGWAPSGHVLLVER